MSVSIVLGASAAVYRWWVRAGERAWECGRGGKGWRETEGERKVKSLYMNRRTQGSIVVLSLS